MAIQCDEDGPDLKVMIAMSRFASLNSIEGNARFGEALGSALSCHVVNECYEVGK